MTFKPGAVRPELPPWQKPKWEDTKKVNGRPLRPDLPPEEKPIADGFVEVASGTTVQKMERLPNQRGKGGRPTKAQERDSGKLEGARKVIEEIRETNPPKVPVPGLKARTLSADEKARRWEREFNQQEVEVEQQEAEASLLYRRDKLNAIKEETVIRKASRSAAMGFGGVALRLVGVMELSAKELEKRMRESPEKLSVRDIQTTLSVASSSIQRASGVMEVAARLERLWVRSPLEGDQAVDPETSMNLEEAKAKVENIMKSMINHARRRGMNILEVEADPIPYTDEPTVAAPDERPKE